MNYRTIELLCENQNVLDTFFGAVQAEVIKKLRIGKELNENEKRYLRGNLGKKINVLENLLEDRPNEPSQKIPLLDGLTNYYIAGFTALRQNGFGWYYVPKKCVIFNTRIKGSLSRGNKRFEFIRLNSIKNRDFNIDKSSGLKYATNEQIYHDAIMLGDESLLKVWKNMLDRYGELFVKDSERFMNENQ